MLIQCPGCGGSTLPRPFCDMCGTSLEQACRGCGAANRPGAKFCCECGEALGIKLPEVDAPTSAQQKQVTVLFADLCNSTRMVASMDAEDASLALGAVLSVMGEAVRRSGGVVNQRMGDGIMALFGAPIAAEDHAARACFAGLAILADVAAMGGRALPVRVGMCSGPVILRRTGMDEADFEVAGITAHIAARLEQHAEPGTILLAPETLRLAAGIAQTELVGAIVLKGLPKPLQAHRLVSARDQPSWLLRSSTRQLSSFVNRTVELAQLTAALGRASHGETQAVSLIGDAGMGKSRIVHEFLHLPPGVWHVIRVETTAQSAAIPYVLLTSLLRQIAGCVSSDPSAAVAARLRGAVLALGPEFTFELSPFLLHFDGGDDTALADSTPARHRRNLVELLVPILRRMTELRPIILVIEDYHWLDISSVELLEDVRRGLQDLRLMLLVTSRPERHLGWARGAETGWATTEIALTPMSAHHANTILRDLIGNGPELAPLRSLIIARAGGTPLFLEEFAQSLREQGTLAEGAPRLSDIVIPGSIQGILAARIDRLPPMCRHILRIAAVVGQGASQALLAAVTDLPTAAMNQAIDVLHATGFLIEDAGAGGPTYSFAHVLTQAVAYDALLRSDRRALHGRVLRALEAASQMHFEGSVNELVYHAISAEAWPEAARYAMAAGERASRRSAPTEARAYLKSAIAAIDRLPRTLASVSQGIDARLSLRGVSASLTDMAGMQDFLQATLAEADQLAEQAGDRIGLARVYISRGAMSSHWGDLPGAIELSRTALSIMQSADDRPGIVAAAFALAQALWYAGDLAETQSVLVTHLALARSPEGQRRSSSIFVLPAVGFFCYLARVQADFGDPAASKATIAEVRALANRAGSMFDQTLVDLNEGACWLAAGDTVQAVEILENTLHLVRANTLEWHMPSIASLLGAGWLTMGRNVEARELLEEACAFADRNRHMAKRLLCSPPLIRALASAPFHDFAGARALADRTIREAEMRGFKSIVLQARAALADIDGVGSLTG